MQFDVGRCSCSDLFGSLQCDVADEMSFSSVTGLYHANSTTGTTEGIKSQQDCRGRGANNKATSNRAA